MPLYEHVYLARQDLSTQQVEELTTLLTGILEANGGKVVKNEYWGLKSLSYRINKNRKSHLTLLNVDAPAAALSEVERQERLNEDVLRYLTIRVEEHEEGPSAMMRKSDRDDRGDRGDRCDRGGGDRGGRGGDRGERRPRRDDEAGETRRWRNRPWHSHPKALAELVVVAAVRAGRFSGGARPARSPVPVRRRSTTRT